MRYTMRLENGLGEERHQEADSWEEAISDARAWVREGEWGEPEYVFLTVIDEVTDESETLEVLVGEDPDEPECRDDEEHDWQAPKWLGGCRENPGIWSLGGTQYARTLVCSRCGKYQHYTSKSTRGQCPRTPARTTYREADESSLEWVAEVSS